MPTSQQWTRSLMYVLAAGLLIAGIKASTIKRGGPGPMVALAALPSGNLIALESRGGLYRLAPKASHLEPIARDFGYYDPIDLAGVRLDNQEVVFVTMYSRLSQSTSQNAPPNEKSSAPANLGRLAQYSAQGQEIRSWVLPANGLYSVAVNSRSGIVYLANYRTSELYTLDLKKDPKNAVPGFFLYLAGTSTLGPVAVDVEHNRLYVAETVGGRLYVVDLETHKYRLLASSLGQPSALAYDPGGQKLYVADAGRRKIWVLVPNASSQKPKLFSSAPELREPRGIAVGANLQIWVADYGAKAIFALSKSGHVVKTISN